MEAKNRRRTPPLGGRSLASADVEATTATVQLYTCVAMPIKKNEQQSVTPTGSFVESGFGQFQPPTRQFEAVYTGTVLPTEDLNYTPRA